MALPKIQHPTFELTIPSNKQKIRYRPFLVKEEKILLLAQESNDMKDMIVAVKQIINNCIVEGDVNIDQLPSFDIEYMFLKLRANSVSDIAKLRFTNPDDGKTTDVEVDLKKVEITWDDNHTADINLTDDIMLTMKYPTYDTIMNVEVDTSTTDITMNMIKQCVDKVYSGPDGEQVDQFKDHSEKEVDEFIDSLTTQNFEDIQNFFNTMPKLEHTINYKMGGKKKTHTFRGIGDFFP